MIGGYHYHDLPPQAQIMIGIGIWRHDAEIAQVIYSDVAKTAVFILKDGSRETIDHKGNITVKDAKGQTKR